MAGDGDYKVQDCGGVGWRHSLEGAGGKAEGVEAN